MKNLTLPFALICLAAPAVAQSEMIESSDDVEIASFGMDADAVEDLDVHGESGNEIGEVEAVIGPDSETPQALVIEFEDEDSFGDEERVVPLDQVTLGEDAVLMHGNLDIESLSTWDD